MIEQSYSATRAAARVALVTCAELPELDPDDQSLVPALAAAGITAVPAVWDDPAVDWSAFDLAVVRNTWDYPKRRSEFTAWAGSVPQLANAADVIAWNTDKRYLRQLADAGIPIVPTTWIEPGDPVHLDTGDTAAAEIVVKPAVSVGSVDTGRYRLPEQAGLATAHIERLQAAGRLVMVQPYLADVDTAGETALLFIAGRYSHAIRKGAILTGPDEGVETLYQEETITPRTPSPAEHALAERVLAALPFDRASLLYARVDLLPAASGDPVVIEVELTEPSLFLTTAADAPDRLAAAIADRLPAPRAEHPGSA
ncbi:ATP-grasp domain-containing protein [Dactylosporangium sp. NBC_01737]|uniref:ATP-grasp domain-containing protein n=1 Tax=Dactylosporangium sp. NBC_01737 TaxID=2975959 RepID=UPI003FA3B37F